MKGGDMEQFMNQQVDMASNNMFSTYFLLKPGADPKKLKQNFLLLLINILVKI
jgi:hypothetical protein